MKLIDLHPRWTRDEQDEICGVTFDCPTCTANGVPLPHAMCEWSGGGGIWVAFENLNPRFHPGATRWKREGDTFETLTLSPSVHCVGHWHGWVRNGEVTTC